MTNENMPNGAASALSAGLGGVLRGLTRTDELTRQLATEQERADYAWRNTRIIEAARQEEMRKRDAAEAEAERLRGLLIKCRGSVKTDLNAYERLIVAKQKHGEQETQTYIAAEAEAQRLFALLAEIDALALATPNA